MTASGAVKRYTRIVTTANGDSAFEDAELTLDEVQLGNGAPPMYIGALDGVTGVAFARLVSFAEPHPATEPQWVIMLRGSIEVRITDGTARRFGAGDLVLADDTTGRGHVTLTVGDGPCEALAVPVKH